MKQLFKHWGLIALIFSFSAEVFPQIKITGNIVDVSDESLPGVTIVIQGSNNGTISDLDGKFELTVSKSSDKLLFSALGFETKEMTVTPGKHMHVVLLEDIKLLDEVVVIGYADIKKNDLTGSVARANLTDMLKAPVVKFDEALAGRIAGVYVSSNEGQPGSGTNIVIRGNNSLSQSNSPLYIIDGFPVEDLSLATSINPGDIESIDVLKDASATAIYGSRGANGVIIINTKRGEAGSLKAVYEVMSGIHRVTNRIPLMNAYEFVRLQEEIWTPVEMYAPNGYFATVNGKEYTLEDYRNIEQYDWQDMIFRDALVQHHNLSLTGGSQSWRFNTSVSYDDQEGTLPNSNYERLAGRMRNTFRQDKLTVDIQTSFSRSTQLGSSPSSQMGTSGQYNLFFNIWGYRPVTQPSVPLSMLYDNIVDETVNPTNDFRFNPILSVNNEYRRNQTDYFQTNAFAEYEFIKGLKLKVSGSLLTRKVSYESFNNSKTRSGSPVSANKVNATISNNERDMWLNENILTYQKQIRKHHNISTLAGITIQELLEKNVSAMTKNIPNESLGMAGFGDGDAASISNSISEWSLLSYLARVNYNYQSKYYLTASFRMDGSSKFRGKNRWGYFPSTSAAWNFSKENFMKPLSKILNNGKIRASWGESGNNRAGYYDTFAILALMPGSEGDYTAQTGKLQGTYPFNSNLNSIGAVPYSLPNKDLKWETTTQTNIGLDLSFFRDRLNFTIDWYNKLTSDLLLRASMVPSSGYGSAMKNIGKIQNRGLEFTVNAIVVKSAKFQWETNFNIAFNRNKVLELAENQNSLQSIAFIDANNASPNYIALRDYPMGLMYGYIYEGTYKLSDFDKSGNSYTLKPSIPHYTSENNTQPGYPKYADLNSDGIVDDKDQTIIGRGNPIHIGGFNNSFRYGAFDLNVFFQWSYGSNILNANKMMFESSRNKAKDLNQFASYANRWTFDNPESDIPRVNNSSSNLLYSSRLIEDGSFLRLKTVALGYNFKVKNVLRKARVYISAQNLFTLTRYSGEDPEVSVRNTALTPGVDYSAYPRAISVNIGASLNF